ncbi:uncharacterized protein LOC143606016 [Bidens hawaiensis]|uniref:uncharacterized protein LOC143606016 n=1 Tax=Bidens hawaiensis TaxID=980011 RepID=UPI00404AD28F
MSSVKGKFMKKLKTIKTIGHLQPDRILHVNAAVGLIDNLFAKPSNKIETHLVSEEEVCQEHEVIDVSELMKDLDDEDGSESSDTGFVEAEKENVRPSVGSGVDEDSKIEILSFRPPDLDSDTLFDPNLLAAFKQAVMEVKAQEEERKKRVLRDIGERPLKSIKLEEIENPLLEFERIYPPGGSESVILYTTGLRSIRKTFEDCSSIRPLLESFKVSYYERDLSMHLDFRDELFRILGGRTVPPRLFIKGRYIGGAEEVLRLHEQGRFRPLLAGIPLNMSNGPCEGCASVRFVVCISCSGCLR